MSINYIELNREKFNGLMAAMHIDITENVAVLETLLLKMLLYNCGSGLFTLEPHLLDHLTESLKRFRSIEVLHASPFE